MTAPRPGHFELVTLLGSGAYADVCVARNRSDQLVALKVLNAGSMRQPDVIERFRDEARILGAVKHPGIVAARRLHEYPDRLVLELEYVHGITLERALVEDVFPPRAALEVAAQVADALHAAYHGPFGPDGTAMRIVHRDLKPANLMLTGAGEVRILDFGIAKGDFAEREAKSLHNVWGSIGYDAPERRARREDGPACDVYALGVTLFVLVTARALLVSNKPEQHPLDVSSATERAAASGVPADLLDLVRRMVAFDPAARPSMLEVAASARAAAATADGPRLAAFAGALVSELLGKHKVLPIHGHPRARELVFLETEPPLDPTPAPSAAQATETLRSLLGSVDWELHRTDARELLAVAADPRALYAVLERGYAPWWRFWSRAPRPAELEAALLLLSDAPEVLPHARALLAHPDPRVVHAARFVLRQA